MNSSLALALVLSARTESASRSINSFTQKSLRSIQELSKRSDEIMAKGFVNIEVGKQFLQPVTSLVDKAVSFESAMAGVAKYADGAAIGTEKFNKLSERALAISIKMGEKAEDVADNMAALAAAGTSVDDLDRMAEKTVILGKAFDVLPGAAGEAYKMIQAGTKYSEKQMDELMDAQNELTNNFGTTKDAAAQLLEFMKGSGASMATALKMDGSNMAAIGNTMRVLAVPTSEAETTMRRFTQTVLKGGDAAKIFAKAGGGTQGFLAIMQQAKKSGNAMKWFVDNKFGEYSSNLSKIAGSMGSGESGDLKKQLDAVSNKDTIKGSASKEAGNVMKTNAEGIKRFQANMEALQITMGSSLLPALNQLLTASKPFLNSLTKWVKENPKAVKSTLGLVAALGGLKIAIGGAQFLFGGFLKPINGIIKGFSAASKGAGFLRRSVMTLRIGAIMSSQSRRMLGIPTTIQKIGTAFLKMRSGLMSGLSGMGKTFSIVGKLLKGGLIKGIMQVGKAIRVVSAVLMANPWMLAIAGLILIVILVIKHWDKIKPFFIKLWAWVKKIFNAAWQWIKTMFLNYTPYGLVIKHWDKISAFFLGLWDKVKTIFSTFWDWLSGWAKDFGNIGKNIVNAIWNGIQNKWAWLKSKALSLWKGFKNVFSFDDNGGNRPKDNPISTRPSGAIALNPIGGARNVSSSMSFAPVINVSGGMDELTQKKLTAQMRRDFEKQMADYNHGQKRKGFA